MTVTDFLEYLLSRNPTHDLALQLAYVRAERVRAAKP
jgi:hypothetical protein